MSLTARMGQMDRGGFDGAMTTASAARIASTTPGAAVASAAPA